MKNVDADYADKAKDRRLVSGIAVTLGGAVVSNASKTQHVVSLSTLEAEFVAAGDGVKEALFVRTILIFIAPETIGASIRGQLGGYGTAVDIPLSSAGNKHTNVRFHFIRDLFRTRKTSVEYVASVEQHADILTKALSRANFQYHRKRLINLSE